MKKIDDFIHGFVVIFPTIIFLIVAIANWQYVLPFVLFIVIVFLITFIKEHFKNK